MTADLNNGKKTPENRIILSEEKLSSWVIRKARSLYVPSSVYRLQFNRNFTFRDALPLIAYLKNIGIEAVYCSPLFQAVPGSLHGYDVTDPNRINPEIGSPEDYERFCAALKAHGMGQILDVVPNHMGIFGESNYWWMDVLENGQSSLYSGFFDIDWDPPTRKLSGKILLPVLGDFYGRVLENQEIRLVLREGEFSVLYYERRFPVDPRTYPLILEHGLQELEDSLGRGKRELEEYLSIITSLRNLPSRTECDPQKIAERNREKEIAKRRLAGLLKDSSEIYDFVQQRLALFNGKKEDAHSFDLLDTLLNAQAYRLGLWSVAAQEINYRRFFNVNDLAAIHTENERVFLDYHASVFDLIRRGKICGLRIDHPDGLYDPPGYFRLIQRECFLNMILSECDQDPGFVQGRNIFDTGAVREVLGRLLEGAEAVPAFFVVGEKILDRREQLPSDWGVHGTVGYDFMNAVNGLFVDQRNENLFSCLYEDYIGQKIDFEDLVYSKKKFFALVHMASEINALGNRLDHITVANRRFRDFTRNDLTLAIREVIACFPVYRTYVSPGAVSPGEKDVQYIRMAVRKAKKKTPALNPAVYDFLQDVLLLQAYPAEDSESQTKLRDFLMRFQQLTGPIMAKGVEDTAFYVYNRLLSLNEVGGDPQYFGCSVEDFHLRNVQAARRWPYSFLAASTHDTKRSEDVRMRLNVLSEIPDEWQSMIREWSVMNDKYKVDTGNSAEPCRNTEYAIYQILLGVWPDQGSGSLDLPSFCERVWTVVLKSVREAKVYTSWIRPDLIYEGAVKAFTDSLLTRPETDPFIKSFKIFHSRISFYGKLNSLSAMLLRLCSPGVVDVYQGDELWNYTLVDPDNRRPVDFERRRNLKNGLAEAAMQGILGEASAADPDQLKLFVLSRLLCFRRDNKEIFVGGQYLPALCKGEKERHIISFVRMQAGKIVFAAAARFFTELTTPQAGYCSSSRIWQETRIILPEGIRYPSFFKDVFTEETVTVHRSSDGSYLMAKDVFRHAFIGLLSGQEDS